MTEKQIAQAFSEQVDDLLAGRTPPGLDKAPLLSLAAEMAANPAPDPSLMFTQRLRRQLLSSLPRERAVRSRRRWSFVGIATMLLLVLALTLVWNPGAPSVTEVLARAADAVAITPGQITYVVSKLEVVGVVVDSVDNVETVYNAIQEYWARAGTIPDGRLTSVEIAGNVYAADDTDLAHPQMQHYSTLSKLCVRSLDPFISPRPDLDDEGCVTLDTPPSNNPDPMAVYAGESFQDWISRMRANVAEIEFHENRFNDRPVYSLTYREAGHQTQSPITVNHTTTGTIIAWGSNSVPITVVTYTVTLYIDRETYLPVGVISKAPDSNMVFTQTILEYQVLNPTDLDFDPFAWPPGQGE